MSVSPLATADGTETLDVPEAAAPQSIVLELIVAALARLIID
ncbi:MAG: hypothetical protein ACO3O9_04315 [Candidatus Nanopelagicales bacterium]